MIGTSTRKDEALDRLTSGIAQLTSSDRWTAWLRVQACFHSYSFNNTFLILVQRPTASRVAGFHTWRRLGRFVRRGEQAVWILAPVTRRVADDDSEKPVRTVVAFRTVAVFAEDQTEGEPLPEVCTRLHGEDPQGVYVALVQVAHSLGFTVEDHAFDDETNGDCSHMLRRIRVGVTLEPSQRAKTLAHELAHALLHMDRSERALMELEAESVAFVVCDALGIDAGAWSFGYVAGWSAGGDEAIAAIKAAGTRIQRTAECILQSSTPPSMVPASRRTRAGPEPISAAKLTERVAGYRPGRRDRRRAWSATRFDYRVAALQVTAESPAVEGLFRARTSIHRPGRYSPTVAKR